MLIQMRVHPQYEALERLYEEFRDRGFAVLGFPANDFAGQEPGSNEEIVEFCTGTYGVQFPLFSKITVTGAGKHPLYAELTSAVPHAHGDKEAFRGNLRGYGMTPTEDPGGALELREVPRLRPRRGH